ncbi:uncharacterized protein LOC135810229 [Sycon ciliatum]|uniref:uncharacterized protein LOC135810229 n=1 Tax=Sycon ciliatum TaxID=27933 RepID=UPI0031F6480B
MTAKPMAATQRCVAALWLLFLCTAVNRVASQSIVSLAGGSPEAKKDSFYLVDGKLTQQIIDDDKGLQNISASLSRLQVMFNDRIIGYTEDTCVEAATPQQSQTGPTKITFEEVSTQLGITVQHRTQKPVRPYCLFHYEVTNRNNSGVSRLDGEFCVPEHITGAAAAADYDRDGLVDLFFTNAEGPSVLYRNTGSGFEDVTSRVGLGPSKHGSGAAWLDIDSDGDLDLYVTTVGHTRHYLYVNKGGVFLEEAVLRNIDLAEQDGRKLSGMTPNVGDYDRDGYPDVYVSEWSLPYLGKVSASRLMHNKGRTAPGTFEDVTTQSGVTMPSTYMFCSSFTDMDNDGWGDIIITADYGDSKIFWNNKNGTFKECTAACGVTVRADAMGHSMADWDMDGVMDWWMTAIHGGNKSVNCDVVGCTFSNTGNLFYRNKGNRRMEDLTDKIGIREGYWGWGNSMFDFNNDRWVDFIMTNGFDTASTTVDDLYKQTPSRLWENRGPKFNLSAVERAVHYGINHTAEGRGLLTVDIDDDGDEDVIIINAIGTPTVLKNQGGNRNKWIKIKVRHACPNDAALSCDSLGSRVYVTSTDGYTQMQEIGSGSQFMAQNELTAHFGLGNLTDNVAVRVTWPWLGKSVNISDVPPNSRLRVLAPPKTSATSRTYGSLQQCPKVLLSSVSKLDNGVNLTVNPDNRTISVQIPPEMTDISAGKFTISFNYTIQLVSSSASLKTSTTTVEIASTQLPISHHLLVNCKTAQYTPTIALPGLTHREIAGFGNNQKNPIWGASGANLRREVPQGYSDSVATPSGQCTQTMRINGQCTYPLENTRDGSVRPSPRNVSNVVFQQVRNVYSSRGLSDMHSHFGQFLAHDTDFSSPLPRFETDLDRGDVWFPIGIPKGDVHFDPYVEGSKFMSFVRTTYSRCTGRSFKRPREQFNKISSIIDATQLYGDEDRLKLLRTHKNGKLIVDKIQGEEYIPLNRMGLANDNPVGRPSQYLCVAGDTRANVQPGLIVLHTLFVREHNRLCDLYIARKPTALDLEVFEYARRIVIAELQAITYREYLPALLGQDLAKYTGYDSKVNPSVSNIFATAAFRFGHSQVNTHLWRFDENGSVPHVGHVALREAYFTPERVMHEGGVDPYLRGMVEQRAQEIDTLMIDDMRNVLFPVGRRDGLDLAALNIQRSRDHGIPDYNTARKEILSKFYQDIAQITKNTTVVSQLKAVYPSVDVLDAWVGGLAEDHVSGSELGPMFHKIIVANFEAIRNGDRFWYERIMNKSEIEMIHNLTLTEIIKLNTGVKSYPSNPFFATRFCKSVLNHQCVPVDKPSCPGQSSTTNPPTMASFSPTGIPSGPPDTDSQPDIPTPLPCVANGTLPTSPCCTDHVLCEASLASVQRSLNMTLADVHRYQETIQNLTNARTETLVLLANCTLRATQSEQDRARLSTLSSNLQATISNLRATVTTLQGNISSSSQTMELLKKEIVNLRLKVGGLENSVHLCLGNASLTLGQCLISQKTLNASLVQAEQENTQLTADLQSCQADLVLEKHTSSELRRNLSNVYNTAQLVRTDLTSQLKQQQLSCNSNASSLLNQHAISASNMSSHLNACRADSAQYMQMALELSAKNANISRKLTSAKSAAMTCSMHWNVAMANLSRCEAQLTGLNKQLNTSSQEIGIARNNFTRCLSRLSSDQQELVLAKSNLSQCVVTQQNITQVLTSTEHRLASTEAQLHTCTARLNSIATGTPATTPDTTQTPGMTSSPPDMTSSPPGVPSSPQAITSYADTTSHRTHGNGGSSSHWISRDQLTEWREKYEKNITWHRERLHNVSNLYSAELSHSQDLEEQLSSAQQDMSEHNTGYNTSMCLDPWRVMYDTYQGRIVISVGGGFFLLSVLLSIVLCCKGCRRTGPRPVVRKGIQGRAFNKRRYSTTEKPIILNEFPQDNQLY